MPSKFTDAHRELLLLLDADWVPAGKLTTYGSVAAQIGVTAQDAWKLIHDLGRLPRCCHLPWHPIVSADGWLAANFPVRFITLLQQEGHRVEPRSKRRHRITDFVDHRAATAATPAPPTAKRDPSGKLPVPDRASAPTMRAENRIFSLRSTLSTPGSEDRPPCLAAVKMFKTLRVPAPATARAVACATAGFAGRTIHVGPAVFVIKAFANTMSAMPPGTSIPTG